VLWSSSVIIVGCLVESQRASKSATIVTFEDIGVAITVTDVAETFDVGVESPKVLTTSATTNRRVSKMTKRPILLLDVMETLVCEPFYEAMPKHFGITFDQLLEAKHPTTWVEFEKAEITEDECAQNFFRDGRQVDMAALRSCVCEVYEWMDGMHDRIRELHTCGYEMHALSNYPIWYEMIEEKLCLSRYVEWTFVSWRTGLRKPDPQAYVHAANSLNVLPEQCIFIDDRQVNVTSAKEVGMDSILMRGANELRRELSERGLIGGEN
jgi:FMN phosphatase YigB (HAD superfamily)